MRRGKTSGKYLPVLLTAVLLTLAVPAIFAGGTQESAEAIAEPAEELDIVIAVLKGPSGFAAAEMVGNSFQPAEGVKAEYIIVSSPIEAVAKMTSGEIDAAFLPVNLAAKLYNKGLKYRLAAVSGLGSLYMLSTDSAVKEWPDLEGRRIYLTGKGATPDYLLRYLLIKNGMDPEKDVQLDFSAGAPQIVQLIAAGKADTAFIPQPFALQAAVKTPAEIVLDPQQALMELSGASRAFPFTAFVLSERLVSSRPDAAESLSRALGDSIEWVLANPKDAAAVIDGLGIMGAAVAESAIPVSGITYIPAAEAEAELNSFLGIFLDLDPASVGGVLPDEGFIFKN